MIPRPYETVVRPVGMRRPHKEIVDSKGCVISTGRDFAKLPLLPLPLIKNARRVCGRRALVFARL